MSLTSIAALLQSALMLLTAAQTTPNLSQSFRDNAAAVAQEAISAATSALASSTASTNTSATYTLPNGAVVSGSGDVITPSTASSIYTNPNASSLAVLFQEQQQVENQMNSCFSNLPSGVVEGNANVALQSQIAQCNSYAAQLGTINASISTLEGVGPSTAPSKSTPTSPSTYNGFVPPASTYFGQYNY